MASSTGNIKQAYAVNGDEIYPKVILDALEGEGGITGIEVIKEAIGGMGMENLKGVSVEYEDDGTHHLVFKSHYEESAGGYLRETVVDEGPFIIGKYSETNPYADDHVYVSKNLSILEDINALEFAANADAVNRRDISGKIAHANNSIQIINYDTAGKLELFGGGETVNDCVAISASSVNIPKDVSITKNLTVSGSTTVATTSGSTLSVGGDAAFSKTVTVDGKSRFNDDVSLHGRTASNRGRSPMLSFTSYQKGVITTNKTTGYIVENYDASGKSSLNMYDVSIANALASLSGSKKQFNVQLNGYGMLYLDGVAKTASIYADSDDNAYLSIDGADNIVNLKASEDTYINLNDENGEHDIAINADDNTFLHLWGGDEEGVVHLNATSGTKLDMYGDVGNVYLHADSKNYLFLNGEEDYVRLKADNSTYLTIYGGDTESVVLKAKDGMYLGMNDSSGYLTLQAKEGTYLGFDVSGNNKSVGLYADTNSYLLMNANSSFADFVSGSTGGKLRLGDKHMELYSNNGNTSNGARLYLDDRSSATNGNVFLTNGSNSYLAFDNNSQNYEHRLILQNDASAYIDMWKLDDENITNMCMMYFGDYRFLSFEAYDYDGDLYPQVKLSGGEKTYIRMDDYWPMISVHANDTCYVSVDHNDGNPQVLVQAASGHKLSVFEGYSEFSHQAKAKVPYSGSTTETTYLGCPIGTIVMWGSSTAPDHWVFCDGASYKRTGTYAKLYAVIGTTFGSDGTDKFKVPNFNKNFPVGAEDGSIGTSVYSAKLGASGGESVHKLTYKESGLPYHRHQLSFTDKSGEGAPDDADSGSSVHSTGWTGYQGGTGWDAEQAHNNIPPYLAIKFIIKYA